MEPHGRILEFRSPVDGLAHPVAVCATGLAGPTGRTGPTAEPLPLILEVSPGAITDLAAAVALTEEVARMAADAGRACVVARPTGRGPGSVYQNYGEVDVLEAIELVAGLYAIDRDRIAITGASMGGAATFYLASHYPDLFAAAAPFCGYADYRLWEKPGGLTFQMRPWEEPSWQARSAAFAVENLARTPIWMVHGEWDRAVGGGVSVEHSREMARLLAAQGSTVRYTELPKTGHDTRQPELFAEVVAWLLDKRKDRMPNHVALATFSLRHNRSEWVAIEQLARYGERGFVDARLADPSALDVRTDNVRMLSLGPVPGTGAVALTLDGQAFPSADLDQVCTFRRDAGGRWQPAAAEYPGEKRHGASGPVGDLFFDGTLLVVGTIGSDEETFFNDWAARDAVGHFQSRNGGVHRGGILGRNTVELPVIRDVDVTGADRRANNLLCYGTPGSNAVLKRYEGELPVVFEGDRIRLADRSFVDPYASVVAAFPHPEHRSRYVAVHGGLTPDAVTWGSHLDLQLLPDFLAYARGEVLGWGFWGSDWRSQA